MARVNFTWPSGESDSSSQLRACQSVLMNASEKWNLSTGTPESVSRPSLQAQFAAQMLGAREPQVLLQNRRHLDTVRGLVRRPDCPIRECDDRVGKQP